MIGGGRNKFIVFYEFKIFISFKKELIKSISWNQEKDNKILNFLEIFGSIKKCFFYNH
jgi:hypothetical protein